MLSPQNLTFLIMVTGLDAHQAWSYDNMTFLGTLDVNATLNHINGLDVTRQPLEKYEKDLETPLEEAERILAICQRAAMAAPGDDHAQQLGNHRAGALLGTSCARLLRWIRVGSDDITNIREFALASKTGYSQAGDTKAACWAGFIADLVSIICERDLNATDRGFLLGSRFADHQGMGEAAAYVCLRLARKLRLRNRLIQASGGFDCTSGLLLYGIGLCQASGLNVVLAQMHATYARLMVDVNHFAVAADHFQRAYSYGIAVHDDRLPENAFYPVVDGVFKTLMESNNNDGIAEFRVFLRETWLERFRTADGLYTIWKWETKVDLRQKVRANRFRRVRKDIANIFREPLWHPQGSEAWMMEKFWRTNLAMNYGPIELAKNIIEELNGEPYNFFSTVAHWERSTEDTWWAFVSCVERTAFETSLFYLDQLKKDPTYLSLSPDAQEHDLGDYKKLVHVARVYIFQEKWAKALALLKCSCSLLTEQRQKTTDEEVQQSQYDSADAEKALDWTVWTCLHFHNSSDSPSPRSLDRGAAHDTWAEEALHYAEMGKARGIADALLKQHDAEGAETLSKAALQGETIMSQLSDWLDPETLVIHLTLIHEGLGMICADTSGIRFAQWFADFRTWNVLDLTSTIFSVIEDANNRFKLDSRPKARAKVEGAMKELSTALITPIRELLKTSPHRPRRLCFIPAGHLSRVPFAALELDGSPLIDSFAIYQAPSLAVLKSISEQAKQKPRGPANIAIISAVNSPESPLLSNAVECCDVLSQFGNSGRLFSAGDLTKEGVLHLLAANDIVHIGAHGDMDPEHPLDSRIYLSPRGDQDLTVKDMRGARSRARLIFLSACLTALGHSTMTDDMAGFQTAILASGALSFAGSLWKSHGLATLFFVHFLYEQVLEKSQSESSHWSLVDAFAEAQRQLRALTGRAADRIIDEIREKWEGCKFNGELPEDVHRDGALFFEEYGNQRRDNFSSLGFWAPFVLVGYSCPLN